MLTATAKAKFNRADMMILHTVMTGYYNCVSIVAKTNDAGYLPDIERFNASAGMDPATDLAVEQPVPGGVNAETGPAGAASNAVSYALTNWDDGWTSEAKEQWVKISKQDMQVLVHYPHQRADAYNSVLKDGLQNAWNILVAPRYTDIHNYELKPIQSYESIAFAEADGRDKISGRNVHIVLFKKHYSGGNGRYLEFITRDKISFEREFGVYHNDEFGWDKLSAMQFRNKFAVNNIDLAGKWSASDYASLSYYYVNSGGFAGATATSVSHEFSFGNDGTYQSDQAGASGVVGNQKFSRQVYKGRYTIKNWEMELTNRFQGGTEKYDCYFEAVSGGRILMLRDRNNTTYSLVKQQ